MQAHAERIYAAINRPMVEKTLPFVVTEVIRPGSVMARSPNYLGIVINEDLPVGTEGTARLKTDRHYFFLGERITCNLP